MSSIERLLNPISEREFYEKYWEQKHLYISKDSKNHVEDLLNIEDLDKFLARNDLRYPTIRLVQNGRELPINEYSKILNFGKYSSEGLLDTDKILHNYTNGATILIQLARSSFYNLALFTNDLQNTLKSNIEANIYLTPENSQGFTTHFDTHSVFVIQLQGSKLWRIYNTLFEQPTLEDKFKESKHIQTVPIEEILLKQGDVLYVPKGLGHDAITTNELSLHVTIGLFPPTWLDIYNFYLKELHKNVNFRKSPISFIRDTTGELFYEEFKTTLGSFDKDTLFSTRNNLVRYNNSRQSQLNKNRLIETININSIDLNSKVCRRENVIIQKETSSDETRILFYDKSINLPPEINEELTTLLDGKVHRLKDFSDTLDDESILELAKILILEGILKMEN